MVQSCIVRDCSSTWCPGGDLRFHAFPQNCTRRQLWLSILPLKIKFYQSARICNLHFQESDYDLTTRRLKLTAVPTIITNAEAVSPCKKISLYSALKTRVTSLRWFSRVHFLPATMKPSINTNCLDKSFGTSDVFDFNKLKSLFQPQEEPQYQQEVENCVSKYKC